MDFLTLLPAIVGVSQCVWGGDKLTHWLKEESLNVIESPNLSIFKYQLSLVPHSSIINFFFFFICCPSTLQEDFKINKSHLRSCSSNNRSWFSFQRICPQVHFLHRCLQTICFSPLNKKCHFICEHIPLDTRSQTSQLSRTWGWTVLGGRAYPVRGLMPSPTSYRQHTNPTPRPPSSDSHRSLQAEPSVLWGGGPGKTIALVEGH